MRDDRDSHSVRKSGIDKLITIVSIQNMAKARIFCPECYPDEAHTLQGRFPLTRSALRKQHSEQMLIINE